MSDEEPAGKPADYDFALELFRDGFEADAIEVRLVDRGLSREAAKSVVADLMLRFVHADAVEMLEGGMLPQQVEKYLRDRGLTAETARSIVENARNMKSEDFGHIGGESTSGGNPILMVLGGIIFVVGLFLFIGNISGAFPTFPCAGWLGIMIGGAIWGAGKKK